MSDSKMSKDFIGDGHTIRHDDGSKTRITPDLIGDGYTIHNPDGTKSKVTKDLIGDGYTIRHADGSKSKLSKDFFGGGYTAKHSDGSKTHYFSSPSLMDDTLNISSTHEEAPNTAYWDWRDKKRAEADKKHPPIIDKYGFEYRWDIDKDYNGYSDDIYSLWGDYEHKKGSVAFKKMKNARNFIVIWGIVFAVSFLWGATQGYYSWGFAIWGSVTYVPYAFVLLKFRNFREKRSNRVASAFPTALTILVALVGLYFGYTTDSVKFLLIFGFLPLVVAYVSGFYINDLIAGKKTEDNYDAGRIKRFRYIILLKLLPFFTSVVFLAQGVSSGVQVPIVCLVALTLLTHGADPALKTRKDPLVVILWLIANAMSIFVIWSLNLTMPSASYVVVGGILLIPSFLQITYMNINVYGVNIMPYIYRPIS